MLMCLVSHCRICRWFVPSVTLLNWQVLCLVSRCWTCRWCVLCHAVELAGDVSYVMLLNWQVMCLVSRCWIGRWCALCHPVELAGDVSCVTLLNWQVMCLVSHCWTGRWCALCRTDRWCALCRTVELAGDVLCIALTGDVPCVALLNGQVLCLVSHCWTGRWRVLCHRHCRICWSNCFVIFCPNSVTGMDFLWGGNPVDHAAAQEDSWKRILEFLKTHLSWCFTLRTWFNWYIQVIQVWLLSR